MDSQKFARYGGVALLAIAIVSLLNAFPQYLWLSYNEEITYLIIGGVLLLGSFLAGSSLQDKLALLVGILTTCLAVCFVFHSSVFAMALSNNYEHAFLIIFGAWGLLAGQF